MTIILIATFPLTACNKDKNDNSIKKITLCEVTHSIFYAPQYVAIENGYFADEGLELTVTNGFGADKVMTALISGDADIGFMGSESSIYVYAEGSDDYAVNFAGLTQRAGNFLVGREANDNFEWSELKGKTVIGGRAGGMPQMLFEYILKKNNINPETDLEILQNVDFGSTSAAFTSGIGDYTVEFEPSAVESMVFDVMIQRDGDVECLLVTGGTSILRHTIDGESNGVGLLLGVQRIALVIHTPEDATLLLVEEVITHVVLSSCGSLQVLRLTEDTIGSRESPQDAGIHDGSLLCLRVYLLSAIHTTIVTTILMVGHMVYPIIEDVLL